CAKSLPAAAGAFNQCFPNHLSVVFSPFAGFMHYLPIFFVGAHLCVRPLGRDEEMFFKHGRGVIPGYDPMFQN
ncbi:MAG: hypothetical protein LUD69_01490, partial [Oscillospiraceae bacterium]|nr:hypothetical protein [Oscillospiraceae bacterium]